ncbi:hypothetical protein [Bacillus cereus]|uniref:hypothetical protein n=1 Tax=Bacillus cereus TaxID=1396 RepID=UPI0026A778B5
MVTGRVKRRLKDGNFIIHRYYYCGAWRNKGTAACSSNGVKADMVGKFVFNKIRDSLCNKDIVKK